MFRFDFLAIIILIIGLASLAVSILMIIATWRLFEKAGEPGWQILIPVYGTYVLYKIIWKTEYFFLLLGCLCSALIINSFDFLSAFLFPVAWIAYAVIFFLNLISTHKLSTAFGHGIVFTLGLLLCKPLFLLILAFGSSRYYPPYQRPQ